METEVPYSFNPVESGFGRHLITYNYTDDKGCSASASDEIEVTFTISFMPLEPLCSNIDIENNLGGGSPVGGVYTGLGVTDNDDGVSFTFNPAVAGGVASETMINYTIVQQLGLDIDGEAEGDLSGSSVSLSSDGRRVAIGAVNNFPYGATSNSPIGSVNSGHVRVYEHNGGQWEQLGGDINGESWDDLFGGLCIYIGKWAKSGSWS